MNHVPTRKEMIARISFAIIRQAHYQKKIKKLRILHQRLRSFQFNANVPQDQLDLIKSNIADITTSINEGHHYYRPNGGLFIIYAFFKNKPYLSVEKMHPERIHNWQIKYSCWCKANNKPFDLNFYSQYIKRMVKLHSRLSWAKAILNKEYPSDHPIHQEFENWVNIDIETLPQPKYRKQYVGGSNPSSPTFKIIGE